MELLGLIAAIVPEAAISGSSARPGLAGHALLIALGLGALAGNLAGGLTYVLQERAVKRGTLDGLPRRILLSGVRALHTRYRVPRSSWGALGALVLIAAVMWRAIGEERVLRARLA